MDEDYINNLLKNYQNNLIVVTVTKREYSKVMSSVEEQIKNKYKILFIK